MKYKYIKGMREISGFGGSYETACRNMVIAGIKWCDKNVNADITYKEYKNIYGVTTSQSEDCKLMQKAMLKAQEHPSGAQMQACLSHIMYIRKNGWDKYVIELSKEKL